MCQYIEHVKLLSHPFILASSLFCLTPIPHFFPCFIFLPLLITSILSLRHIHLLFCLLLHCLVLSCLLFKKYTSSHLSFAATFSPSPPHHLPLLQSSSWLIFLQIHTDAKMIYFYHPTHPSQYPFIHTVWQTGSQWICQHYCRYHCLIQTMAIKYKNTSSSRFELLLGNL